MLIEIAAALFALASLPNPAGSGIREISSS
jgi:hypothetical protein